MSESDRRPPRRGLALVVRRGGKAVVHWPHFWLLQATLLGIQSTGVVAVARLVEPPARTWLLVVMAAVIVLNAFLVAKRTREMLAAPPDQLPEREPPAIG